MTKKILNHSITLKEHISEKDYEEINQLKKICNSEDKTNLKLELDYKISVSKNLNTDLKNINEFFYYVDDALVSYIGICSFGGNIGEINGMTHPDWRRKGIFKKLFELAKAECEKRNFNKTLLLSDGNSTSGMEFIKSVDSVYDHSEYRMKAITLCSSSSLSSITLRKAEKSDSKEISNQNAIFFGDITPIDGIEENTGFIEDVQDPNTITYMIELKGEVIGKIKVEFNNNSAFICGFGILPNFRGKGYGRSALQKTIGLIKEKGITEVGLDVECKNNTALNLYKSCGFEEKSVMNYYELK